MDRSVYAGRGKKRKSPVRQDQLYRELMKLYASFMRDGVSPKQIDETDLQDWFAMYGSDDRLSRSSGYIDDVMGH